jgi:ATP-dependent Lon protease
MTNTKISLDEKINRHFAGLVVRKDLVKTVKGNAIVPTYVLEYLLGQFCASHDENTIRSGIESVKNILREHYVHRNEAGLIKSRIKEKGRHKVIDKISVALNEKKDVYEAAFANLGIKGVLVDSATIKQHPRLLVSGVWCIAELEYEFTEDRTVSPFFMTTIKPIQLSQFDPEGFLNARREFSTEEWLDLLVQTIGFNPEMFGRRSKLHQLVRLVPYAERNYNLIELGPKGTGKSHIYSEFSPHGILISGGEVTVPKLFVNNSSGKIGLVGYWDVVAFDEFAGKNKRVDKALVDIKKNYMANKSFSRGVESIGAEASMAFVGNTRHTLPYMLNHSDLFDELPEKYYDSAFLDRIHFYVPGWEVDIIRGEMFSGGYGFVVDYLAEILRTYRGHDYSQRYTDHFTLSKDISTRDRDGIQKTFSGMMKILYPHGEATKEEIEELLRFAVEGRKRVKDQLMRIDDTYGKVVFGYTTEDGKTVRVKTLEQEQYPQYYKASIYGEPEEEKETVSITENSTPVSATAAPVVLTEGNQVYKENQRGVTYGKLFGAYLKGTRNLVITDPYIRKFYQIRNLMEFMELVERLKPDGEEVTVHLKTVEDEKNREQQVESFVKIKKSCETMGIEFTWEFDYGNKIHARHIETDHGWKISLDRGLDIFQRYEIKEPFSIANRLQQYRSCKLFDISYHKVEEAPPPPSPKQ